MKTSDLIALFLATPGISGIVGTKVCNTRVPTKDAVTGEIDVPFLWVSLRNQINWELQNPEQGTEPLGKVFDIECVHSSQSGAEDLRDAVQSLSGFTGAMGSAVADLLTVEDQADDYAPRNQSDDAGVYVDSALVQVIGE